MTGQDLIASSMRLIGVLASGETPSGPEAEDARNILNQMLESWSAESLNVFSQSLQQFSLTAGKQVYTFGAGGDFNAARPARIDKAYIQSLNNAAQPLDLEIEMLTDAQWGEIPVKNITSALPTAVYDDSSFPLRNISFFPIPSAAVNCKLLTWSALTQFTDLTTDNTFPPGYIKAIRYNLAVDLAPEFGRQTPVEVAAQAASSKAVIKTLNQEPLYLRCDPALIGRGKAFNWLTGE